MENNLFSILYESGAAEMNPPRIGRKRKVYPDRQRKLIAKRLQEVIYGMRPYLKVYSKQLQATVWFVNEGMINPRTQNFDGMVITMEMLAEMLSDGPDLVSALRN